MVFKKICMEYIHKYKNLYNSYIIISTISYITKIIVTPIIYSSILNIEKENTFSVISKIFKLFFVLNS